MPHLELIVRNSFSSRSRSGARARERESYSPAQPGVDRRRLQNGFAMAIGDGLAVLSGVVAAIFTSFGLTGVPSVPVWAWSLVPTWWLAALALGILPSWAVGAAEEMKRIVLGFAGVCGLTLAVAVVLGEPADPAMLAAAYGIGVVGMILVRRRVAFLLQEQGDWGGGPPGALFGPAATSPGGAATDSAHGVARAIPEAAGVEKVEGRKRRFDLVVLTLTSPLWLPALSLLAFCAWIEDRTDPFARQTRIGRHGQAFRTWRFRTVVPNAAEVLRQRLEEDEALRREWQTSYRLRRDPRVTRVGRLLRRFSLDGLPQLINVLRGEMALVGPEPLPPFRARQLSRDDLQIRASVPPGLIGIGDAHPAADTRYVRAWSPWLDLAILVRSMLPPVRGRQAA